MFSLCTDNYIDCPLKTKDCKPKQNPKHKGCCICNSDMWKVDKRYIGETFGQENVIPFSMIKPNKWKTDKLFMMRLGRDNQSGQQVYGACRGY